MEAPPRWVLVHSLINRGDIEGALAETQLALASGNLTRAEGARFHGLAAQLVHILNRPDPLAAAQRACDEGVASGDPQAGAYGLQALAGANRWAGRFGEALDLATEAAEVLRRAGPLVDGQLDPHLIRGNCLVELDRVPEALDACTSDLRNAEHGLGTFFLCFHHLSVARLAFLDGRWDDALTEIRSARETPDHLGHRLHLDGLATVIAVHRDAVTELQGKLGQPPASGSAQNTFDDRSWGAGLAALAAGDQDRALTVLAGAWGECVRRNRQFCGHYLLPDLVTVATARGADATARKAVAELEQYAANRQAPALNRSARFAAGIAEANPGLLLSAADNYAAVGRPLLEGQAREHAAELLTRAGHTQEARFQLGAAQDRYASLGAAWDTARADARLRRYGIRRGTHGRRQRPKAGWASLTDTEQKIATLVADGLSNPDIADRMFISRRTAQFHVSNILAKLGLGSRVELAAHVARRAG
jgi:DNA-binding CsgD family transcriptional regulator